MNRTMTITRGTTPTFDFVVPFSSSDIATLFVTFYQNGEVIVEKGLGDVTITDVNIEADKPITDMEGTDSISTNDAEVTPEEGSFADVSVKLTQEDTLSFTFHPAAEKNIIVTQIRVLDSNEEAYASDPISLRLYGVLKDGVIGGE